MAAAVTRLPHFAQGKVIKGFGRGSKELGIPTANLDDNAINSLPDPFPNGVYYGWTNINNGPVYKMVMSIGSNPFYNNMKKSMEVHILHKFHEDFYGSLIKVVVLGYIRAETNFPSVETLIAAIQNDIKVASESLDEPNNRKHQQSCFFRSCV